MGLITYLIKALFVEKPRLHRSPKTIHKSKCMPNNSNESKVRKKLFESHASAKAQIPLQDLEAGHYFYLGLEEIMNPTEGQNSKIFNIH